MFLAQCGPLGGTGAPLTPGVHVWGIFALRPGPVTMVWFTPWGLLKISGGNPAQANFNTKRAQKQYVAKKGCHGARILQGQHSAGQQGTILD